MGYPVVPAERGNAKTDAEHIDYKDLEYLGRFLTPQAQILSRRRTNFSAKRQRLLKHAVKHARHLALLPYVG